MKLSPPPPTRRRPRRAAAATADRATVLVLVLIVIAVLSLIASNLMFSASARYHTTYQSASWQEALVAAESGVDLAMNELRKRVRTGKNESFKPPWLVGNGTPGGGTSGSSVLIDPRLLGGAIDPTAVSGVTVPPLFPAYPDNGYALPLTEIATHSGEGNRTMRARVYVDVPGSTVSPEQNFAKQPPSTIDPFMNVNVRDEAAGYDNTAHWWYRIRSVGIAGVSGPPRASLDKRDSRLRRFSFFNDWRTGRPVDSPQVSRLVEVVVKPRTGFRNALVADLRIDLNGKTVLIDSYNSAHGLYGEEYTKDGQRAVNRGTMGNLATNGELIAANYATVKGDAMTNEDAASTAGGVTDGENVTGERRSDFYQELIKVEPPQPGTASTMTLDGTQLNGSRAAGTSGNVTFDGQGKYTIEANANRNTPTKVSLNAIDLTGVPASIELVPPKGSAENSSSYVKIYVRGDLRTAGKNTIKLQSGVRAIFYVTGTMNLEGRGITNVAKLNDRLLINGVRPAVQPAANEAAKIMRIETTQDFQGIIYAPDHDLDLALKVVNTTTRTVENPPSPNPTTPSEFLAAAYRLLNETNPPSNKREQAERKFEDAQSKFDDARDLRAEAEASRLAGDMNNYNNRMGEALRKEDEGLRKMDEGLQKFDKVRADLLSQEGEPTTSEVEDHTAGYNGIYGAFVARKIKVFSQTHLHYDEALRNAGPVNHYEIASWFEDDSSRAGNSMP